MTIILTIVLLTLGWAVVIAGAIHQNKEDVKKCNKRKITFKTYK